jgi:ribose transport system substrate-binding protein
MDNKRRIITAGLVAAPFASAMGALSSLIAAPAFAQQKKYRFGFSQVTTVEPWRVQFNEDMRAEAAKHPEIELSIADAGDRTDKQNADMENFIAQKMDAIFTSPKESVGLTGVVEKAYKAGIPVFVLDRQVNGDAYTQFIGGDNVQIGREAGSFVVKLLGGAGHA